MLSKTRRIAILAKSYNQFLDFLSLYSHPGEEGEYYYVSEMERDKLQGLEFSGMETLGGFWETEHATEVYQLVLTRVR